jgi:ferric-dicitrate binding protein FerR (iron transport regulator)
MNKDPQKTFRKLIGKYRKGIASSEEAAFLDSYYSYFDREAKISDSLSQEEKENLEKVILENIRAKIGSYPANNRFPFYLRKSYRYAAATILTLLCVGALLLLENRSADDIGPGGYKAFLTLNNGSTIALEKAGPGTIATEGKTRIVQTVSGQLAYDTSVEETSSGRERERENVGMNTITTPRGGEYSVTLPDGTKAWLNAVSSIKFPTIFPGKERIVEVTGEVYLEVSKDAKKPFIVKVNGMTEIKVLGTHFNISAYPDEGVIKTTLLEGSVQVSNPSGAPVILSPGQQSTTDTEGRISVQNVDIDAVVAWKNGVFQFNSLSIDEIMRQISRWYKVEVIYQSEKPQGEYSGIVSRNTDLSEVLDMLELSGVKCKIDGERLIVL